MNEIIVLIAILFNQFVEQLENALSLGIGNAFGQSTEPRTQVMITMFDPPSDVARRRVEFLGEILATLMDLSHTVEDKAKVGV